MASCSFINVKQHSRRGTLWIHASQTFRMHHISRLFPCFGSDYIYNTQWRGLEGGPVNTCDLQGCDGNHLIYVQVSIVSFMNESNHSSQSVTSKTSRMNLCRNSAVQIWRHLCLVLHYIFPASGEWMLKCFKHRLANNNSNGYFNFFNIRPSTQW